VQAENSRLTIAAGRRVVQAVDELVAAAGDFLAPRLVHELQAGRARLAQARFNLVVLGEFKRGKSTLINALLGRDVLPMGVVPLTSAVTIMRHGPRDRRRLRAQSLADQLTNLVTEVAAQGTRRSSRVGGSTIPGGRGGVGGDPVASSGE
jgi:hypothetical protein